MSNVIVIGGGAAGMIAAYAAAGQGHRVTLLEQNEKLGKKIFITGKGRCNVTNDSSVENHLAHVVSNPKFLYSAFYTFDSSQMMNMLEEYGLHLKTERGNRVFPNSDKSSDVIKTLDKALCKRGVTVRLHTKVSKLVVKQQVCKGVVVHSGHGEESLLADAVILATGGLSYASTGSTGDGHRMLHELQVNITPCYPALVPIETVEEWPARLQGLSLKNVTLTLYRGKKKLYRELGEMLFTHFGISGPLVLSSSSLLGRKGVKDCYYEIDLKPALSEQQLDERIRKDFAQQKNCLFKNALGKLLPAKMVPVMVELSGISPDKKVNEVTKKERQELVHLCKHLRMTVLQLRGYSEAIVTGGGISVKEIDPATMAVKQISGLYAAGEVLDLDAKTGGYNLQIAWSTGYLAGISIP